MAGTSSIILFNDKRPDAFFLSQLYDPDIDGVYVEDNGKIIPNPGSLCIDNQSFILYGVESVDNRYKSTLKRINYVVTNEDDDDDSHVNKILSYGNDKFYLFFDDRTKYTKLLVDSKLIVFGISLKEYRLIKTNSSGETEVISVYFDTNGDYRGERIPLTDIGTNTGAKQLTNCHTYLTSLVDGDSVIAQIYDNQGILAIEVQLFTKRATILNDLSSTSEVIVGFDATSNQMLGTDFYLYMKQDPSHLAITPRIEYVDGTSEDLVINNEDCFIYGLENFTPSFPGQKQKILIKKYLNYKQMSDLATQIGDKRFVVCEKIINVIRNTSIDNIKVSIVPYWDSRNHKYILKFIAYSDKRNKVIDATNYVTYITEFDGSLFNQSQSFTFDVDLDKIFDLGVSTTYRQIAYITLRPYSEFIKYIISDNADMNPVYGMDSSIMRRPVILYDPTIGKYFVPSSRFQNKEAFLEAFYSNANPPYDVRESLAPPVPTHFTIRAIDTLNTMITTPIAVDSYTKAWNIIDQYSSSALVDRNVIVEFLYRVSDTEYSILYGVPVDVYKVTNYEEAYNTEDN